RFKSSRRDGNQLGEATGAPRGSHAAPRTSIRRVASCRAFRWIVAAAAKLSIQWIDTRAKKIDRGEATGSGARSDAQPCSGEPQPVQRKVPVVSGRTEACGVKGALPSSAWRIRRAVRHISGKENRNLPQESGVLLVTG